MRNINLRNENASPAGLHLPVRSVFQLACVLLAAVLAPTLAQARQVTTEMIAPLTGSLTISYPNGPCFGQRDTITFTGAIHVVATVDTSRGTYGGLPHQLAGSERDGHTRAKIYRHRRN